MRTQEQKREWAIAKANSVGNLIVEQFTSGSLPEALATVFLDCGQRHADKWTGWTNRLLVALAGFGDAATFKQWGERGRKVTKGEKSRCYLWARRNYKRKDKDGKPELDANGKPKMGASYRLFAVFGIGQTEVADTELWAKFAPDHETVQRHLDRLPLREVAESWGMTVGAYTGKPGLALGYYSPGQNAIALGVADMATWAHELIHKADDLNGTLKHRRGDENSEIVAELGGCILLTVLGYERGADRGGAFKYVKSWSKTDNEKAVAKACGAMLERTCQAVALILQTAKELQDPTETDSAADVVDVGEMVAA